MRGALAALAVMLVAACGQTAPPKSAISATPTSSAPAAATPSPTFSASPAPARQAPSPRTLAVAAYDSGRSELVVFGGQGPATPAFPSGYLGDTWTLGPAGWRQASLAGPSGRFAATAAYDPGHGVAVLFGGLPAGAPSGETWTWDGRSWTQQHPAISPPPRQDASMAYDAGHRVVVLFGGQTIPSGASSAQLSDTWEWDGVDWKQLHPATSPSPRVFASMAYDGARGKVVLFGGSSGQGQSYDGGYADTWTWDGANWTKASPSASPPSRSEASMAYDAARAEVVLFGGVGGTGSQYAVLNDTWVWNGATWTARAPATRPPARLGSVMDFDAAAKGIVLFGGMAFQPPDQMLADTWLWNGDGWTEQGS